VPIVVCLPRHHRPSFFTPVRRIRGDACRAFTVAC
jgi:hypothetical protein